MGKLKDEILNNQTIAECIMNDYVCSLEESKSDSIIHKLPLLADNNLACKLSGSEYLDISYVSTYRVFSKFITKYNKSLKQHRRTAMKDEYGSVGTVKAKTDSRISELTKYALEAGTYFAEIKEGEYLVFIVNFDEKDEYCVNYTIWFVGEQWRKTRNKFLKKLDEYKKIKKEEKNEMICYTNGNPAIPTVFKPFDKVVFSDKKKIMKYIDNFINNIPQYYSYGITPKLSIIIHGKPGTGKSTFAKALANYMKIDTVTSVSADYFRSSPLEPDGGRYGRRYGVNRYGRTVYVLDDIDCICKSREEDTSQENAKNTANLLSFLDNPPTIDFVANDGISYPIAVVVATTNYYDKLDSAVKRAGRFDLTIEMKEFGITEAEEMCNIYNLSLDDVFENQEYKKKDFVVSPSKLQAMCLENIDKALKSTD